MVIHPQIDTRVTVQVEGAIRAFGDALNAKGQLGVERCGIGHDAVTLLVFGAPLYPFRRDAPPVVRHLRKRHLPYWKYLEPLIADHAHVELPSVDELLDDRGRGEALVNELHAPRELFFVFDDRRLRNARRGLEKEGFHDDREVYPLFELRGTAAANDDEIGSPDAMVREQLLGE